MHLKKDISLEELADIVNVKIQGDKGYIVDDVTEISLANEKSVIYCAHKKYLDRVEKSKAKVVLVSEEMASSNINNKILLIAKDVEDSFELLINHFELKPDISFNISETVSIASDVQIADHVSISDFVCVGEKSKIGKDTIIYPSVTIGKSVSIGKKCIIHPNVVIYDGTQIGDNVIIHSGTVIGSDGYGYYQRDNIHKKIPQIGNVIIENDVEIGSNVSIDRATLGSTIIKKGVKIDNLVQIAHNVVIDENALIISQCGISGSTVIGKNCILAGQVGVADHAHIEDNVIVGAKTGVPSRTVKSEEKMVFGIPAKPILKAKRIEAIVAKLPEIYQEFTELKKEIIKEKK